jgi:hypothetical protein
MVVLLKGIEFYESEFIEQSLNNESMSTLITFQKIIGHHLIVAIFILYLSDFKCKISLVQRGYNNQHIHSFNLFIFYMYNHQGNK